MTTAATFLPANDWAPTSDARHVVLYFAAGVH